MKANDFQTAKTMEELMDKARPGSSVLIMLYGESPSDSHAELVTILGYDISDKKVYLTSPSVLHKAMEVEFEPDRFATSSWIDLTNTDFTGLIGEHFKSLGKMVQEGVK